MNNHEIVRIFCEETKGFYIVRDNQICKGCKKKLKVICEEKTVIINCFECGKVTTTDPNRFWENKGYVCEECAARQDTEKAEQEKDALAGEAEAKARDEERFKAEKEFEEEMQRREIY